MLNKTNGVVYTPNELVDFMVELARKSLGRFRGKKIVEPSCGTGNFYLKLYQAYVNEVVSEYKKWGMPVDFSMAHNKALEHVFGMDIDPVVVKEVLLKLSLEQLKDNVQPIDCNSVVCQDSIDLSLLNNPCEFTNKVLFPDLIIGNPPYGVKVSRSKENIEYNLDSKDSYGYFIANALLRLNDSGKLIFLVSSSFLTLKSHRKLRDLILSSCKIIRIIKLHRSTFPGIDIFPVIVELEKCSKPHERENNSYEFYDLWQLHPINDRDELSRIYNDIVENKFSNGPWLYDPKRVQRYTVRQGLLDRYSARTIFDGMPSLFQFMNDTETSCDQEIKVLNHHGQENIVKCKNIRGTRVVKLGNIADVKQGLIPPDNRKYYRIAKGIRGGAVKGGYIDVNLNNTLTLEETQNLSLIEKSDGIKIDDLIHDKHFVPLDKPGVSDIEGKILNQYYKPVEFYVNWSTETVHEMKISKQGRFQGASHFFKKGITCSDVGIYSPTFRLGHGGVFDVNGIFCNIFSYEFLLGVLCSKLIKYFLKVFINHCISSHVGSIKDILIAIPTIEQLEALENKVTEIIEQQQKQSNYDYYNEQESLDKMVYALYGLSDSEIEEVENWYARRYPKLRRDV
jgi:hypothetical protein